MTVKRLLLVEDDRALAELVIFHFERAGYVVTRTGDGEEALILAEEIKPDIILLDWMIEGISGIEVCRRLRRRAATAHRPRSLLTARGAAAEPAAHLDPANAFDHPVEQDDVRLHFIGQDQRFFAVAGPRDGIASPVEVERHQLGQRAIVFDQQKAFGDH